MTTKSYVATPNMNANSKLKQKNVLTEKQTKLNAHKNSHHYSLFVEVDSVVVHSTSISTTSRMLPVFTCKGDPQILFK